MISASIVAMSHAPILARWQIHLVQAIISKEMGWSVFQILAFGLEGAGPMLLFIAVVGLGILVAIAFVIHHLVTTSSNAAGRSFGETPPRKRNPSPSTRNNWARTGFWISVCSPIPFIFPVLALAGIVVSIIGLLRSGSKGDRGFAIAGIIIPPAMAPVYIILALFLS